MIIFCYMLLFPFITEEIMALALTYFGDARNRKYFGQRLWQAYFMGCMRKPNKHHG